MKTLFILPVLLLLAACEPDSQPMVELQEVSARVEEVSLPYYPYFKHWEKCEINGEILEEVTFMYTDLGLGYIVDDILYYRLNMEVTWCEGVVVKEINNE